jgi:hypothetical protein
MDRPEAGDEFTILHMQLGNLQSAQVHWNQGPCQLVSAHADAQLFTQAPCCRLHTEIIYIVESRLEQSTGK